jgi:MFS superfamily sulfate permease-like transporter
MTQDTLKRSSLLSDLRSGFLVFLIALPLCLGIAMASGFPPIAGVMTAIVGGVLVSLLGSADLTIKGPAAGLIVIALGAVQELGMGDPGLGYRRALAVGVVAAVLQVVLALARAASVGTAMSPSVVHGMLAAIGVIIISKQSYTALGVQPTAKEPLELLLELPRSMRHANPEVLAIALVSLAILFLLPRIKARWARMVPAPMLVLAIAVPMALWFDLDHSHTYSFLSSEFSVGPQYLVQLPGNLLDAVALPDFSVILSPVSLKYVVMFALVGSIESTLSVIAVDSMDPRKRTSNLNRDLLATGIGNLVSSLIGGLPMISEIVRSKANVDAGAQSSWSNFFHGAFLLGFVALAPGLLHQIPLAALAAMLIYTGSRLASPSEFAHARKIGHDQLLLFLTTLLVTLATDLLIGVAVGLLLKVLLHRARGVTLASLFRPRVDKITHGEEVRLRIHGAAAFSSILGVRKALEGLPAQVRRVVIDLRDVVVVDHTFLNRIHAMANELPHATIELVGLDRLHRLSEHPHATHHRRSK